MDASIVFESKCTVSIFQNQKLKIQNQNFQNPNVRQEAKNIHRDMTSKKILERKYAHAVFERDRIEKELEETAEKLRKIKQQHETLIQTLKKGQSERKAHMIVVQNLYDELTSNGLFLRDDPIVTKKPKLKRPTAEVSVNQTPGTKKARIEETANPFEESVPGFSQVVPRGQWPAWEPRLRNAE